MSDPKTGDEDNAVVVTVYHPTMGTMEFVVKDKKHTDVSINHHLN